MVSTSAVKLAANLEHQLEYYSQMSDITDRMLTFLRSPSWEERVDKLCEFLAQRQELIGRIDPIARETEGLVENIKASPGREDQRGKPKELLVKLEELKLEIQQQEEEARIIIKSSMDEVGTQLKSIRIQKKAARVYSSPVSATEGAFIDSKR